MFPVRESGRSNRLAVRGPAMETFSRLSGFRVGHRRVVTPNRLRSGALPASPLLIGGVPVISSSFVRSVLHDDVNSD